ncbi:stage II sporulation protein M [Leuconostocaceae bacterium ESL0958]|nr:stage II sporulation protein M [Leuconostocaceae bacterium ESL0958]
MRVYQKYQLKLADVKKYFYLYLLLITIGFLIPFVLRINALQILVSSMAGRISDDATQGHVFLYFIYNNALKVPLFTFIIALIPIPYLFVTVLLVNAIILGLAFSLPVINHHVSFIDLLLGVGPNGFFEQFAILITVVCAAMINKAVCKKIYASNEYVESEAKLLSIIKTAIMTYILYALPLFLIAAVAEAYLVPMLTN